MKEPCIAFVSAFIALSFCVSCFSGCKNDFDSNSIGATSNSDNTISCDSSELTNESLSSVDSPELSEELQSEEFQSEASFSSMEDISKDDVDTDETSESVSKDPYEPVTPIPETLNVDDVDNFFNDSVFIGYSIMMHFGKYIQQWKMDIDESIMGESIFCCGVGMNFIQNRRQDPDFPDNILPKYQGQAYNFEDLPKATGSRSMYIGLMPYSEIRHQKSENYISGAVNETINGIKNIKSKNPDLNLVILSGTYNTGTYATGAHDPARLNNVNVREYNIQILEYCNENGIDFIDVSTALLDGRGYMPVEYASDEDYHIKKDVFKIWINILRDYAEQKQNGNWKNIETMPPLVKE